VRFHLPSLPPWAQTVIRVIRRSIDGETTVNAGGIALFALLAAVPLLAATVSIYGLVADPAAIEGQVSGLARVFPFAVVDFLVVQLERAAQSSTSALSASLVFSIAVAIFSARNATNAVIAGLNDAYGLVEERTALRRFVTSITVSLAALVAILLVVTIVVVFPTTVRLLGLGAPGQVLSLFRWPAILVAITGLLAALYRTGPSGGVKVPRRLLPGAIVGTLIWLLASLGLSVWVDRVADYEILYGAFAGVIVVLVWFYLSALAVLIGAAVNAELGPSGHRHKWKESAKHGKRRGPVRDPFAPGGPGGPPSAAPAEPVGPEDAASEDDSG
jgi:membrane protein